MLKQRYSVRLLRQGKNLALSQDACLEKVGVLSEVTPRKVVVRLKQRGKLKKKAVLEVSLMGIHREEALHLLGSRGRH